MRRRRIKRNKHIEMALSRAKWSIIMGKEFYMLQKEKPRRIAESSAWNEEENTANGNNCAKLYKSREERRKGYIIGAKRDNLGGGVTSRRSGRRKCMPSINNSMKSVYPRRKATNGIWRRRLNMWYVTWRKCGIIISQAETENGERS